jgi:NADH-quinone oxidoreductase subunit F
MMGSGGMVVMDEDSCVVDVSRYFLDFTQKESCGKCTFCRIGTRHLLNILRAAHQGARAGKETSSSWDLEPGRQAGIALRAGQDRPQSGADLAGLFPG